MKLFRPSLFLACVALLCSTALLPSFVGWVPVLLAIWLVGTVLGTPRPRLCVTLTVSEIMSDVLQAFKTRVPGLNYFASDFGSQEVKYGHPIIAHLPSLPVAYDHNASSGYSNNAQSARSLLTDVSITMDGWKDVPIKILAADASQDRSQNYLKTISNAGYVLGKAVVDYALGKAVAANLSQSTTETISNTSSATLGKVRVAMNGVKAGNPRYMLCNSDFFAALDEDPRITSGDYYAQRSGGEPFGRLVNCKGFAEISEYPDFPGNAEGLSALAFDSRAIGIATRLPIDSTDVAGQLGLPVTYKKEVVQDPESGLSIVGFAWIDQDTHNIYVVSSVMFGAVAGMQGGSAGEKTDYAGHRIVTGS